MYEKSKPSCDNQLDLDYNFVPKSDDLNSIEKIMEEKKSRLCFSADIYDTERLLTMLDKIGQYIVICKIHYDCYKCDEDIKRTLIDLSVKHNFLLMEDRKFVDISFIVQRQYRQFSSWIDLVTVMGNVNSTVLS